MFKLVDIENYGEFPVSKRITRVELIPELIRIVGELLVQIKPLLEDKKLILTYCFQVEAGYKVGLESILSHAEQNLPQGCQFYVSDGQRVYDMRGPKGGIVTSVCFYLIVIP